MHSRNQLDPTGPGFRVVIIAFQIVATGAWVGFALAAWSTLNFKLNGHTTTGTVVDIEINRDSDGSTYRPTFEYTDINKATQQGAPLTATSWWDYRVGDRVEIVYDPANPAYARPTGFMSDWFAPLFAAAFGTAFTLAAGLGARQRRRALDAQHDPTPA